MEQEKTTAQVMQKVDANSQEVNEMVNLILANRTSDLDTYIDGVRSSFLSGKDIPDQDLDKIILRIPVFIYYLTTVAQDIEVKQGVASESAKFFENEVLLVSTGTVAEKQAKANNGSIKDRIVQVAYKAAASLVKTKMNAAMEILSSAKKIQARRLEEMKLTKLAGNSVESAF